MIFTNRTLASRLVLANAARLLVVIVVMLGVAVSTKAIVDSSADLDRTHSLLEQTLTVKSLSGALEINIQRFLDTGNREFLGAFREKKEALDETLIQLQQGFADRPEPRARLEEIRILVNEWVTLAIASTPTADATQPGVPQLQQAGLSGNTSLEAIKAKLTTLETTGRQHLMAQRARMTEVSEQTLFMLIGGSLVIVLTGLGFALMATLGITRDLKRLSKATLLLAEGDLNATANIHSNDEVGMLSRSFDRMVERLRHIEEIAKAIAAGDFSQQVQVRDKQDRLAIAINQMSESLQRLAGNREAQDWQKTGQAELHTIMRNEHDLLPLTQKIITYLANYLKAQIGVFYLAEDEQLRLVSSYAYTTRNNNDNQFRIGEGLIGQAALEQQSILYSLMPGEQNPLVVNGGMGEFQPVDVIVLPLVHEGAVQAVLSLGVNRKFSALELEFLEKISQSLAISIHVTRTQRQFALLLEESTLQAEELKTQQEELKASNEELEEHAEMLAQSEETLRHKSNELQQLNTELEERTEDLERQKTATEEKNHEIEKAKRAVEIQAQNLARASQYKSEFLANMSHELRTPLNSLLILSQSLANNNPGNLSEEQVEDAKVIYQGGKALLGLINDILDLSKVEAGKLDIRVEDMSIASLLDNLLSQFNPIAVDKGIDLSIEPLGDLPATLCTDPQRVEQVLRNLLSNGLKFTHEGSVGLRAYRLAESVPFHNPELNDHPVIAFAVSDTGIGIPEDKQQGIFEAFQQADGSTSRVYGGTGLGLTISRELVRLLGGEIQLHSREGGGSTFTLYLPLNSSPATPQDARTEPAAGLAVSPSSAEVGPTPVAVGSAAAAPLNPQTLSTPAPTPNTLQRPAAMTAALADDRDSLNPGDKSVLIIEDDRAFARILVDLSRKKGYPALAALQGSQGLQLALEYQPSAIILDLGLPDIGGRQVLKQLKQNIKTRHIPVHILSAEDKDSDLLQMGAMGFLTKPVSGEVINSLFAKIEGLLQEPIKQLLLVEDDSSNRQAVIRLIGNQDVDICAVRTGQEAHEKLLSSVFDCIILDLSLPDISGFDLLDQLSQDSAIVLPPIVVYTGRDLTPEEYKRLNEYTRSIVIKGASSPERLLDETTLFLHSVESSLPHDQRTIIQMLYNSEQQLQGRKILLVDDDLRNTYALSRALSEQGLEVSMADNGELALQKLAEEDIELVLMDIMMPVMDGYEAMRRIRQQARFKKLPIIALTAKAMLEDRTKCIEAGANDYCTKPVEIDRLMSMMRVWLFR